MKTVKLLSFYCLTAVFVCLLTISVAQSQENSESDAVFDKHLASDNTVLKNNPNIAEAHGVWKSKIEESTTAYRTKLEALLEREKSKSDLDFLKGMETIIEKAKSQHVSPCILFERLPPKIAPLLADMNKAKSKANKIYLAVLDKEIAAALKQKKLDDAKAIEQFFYVSFLPKIMEARFSETARYENKIFLFVEQEKSWQDAYNWSRERNGDLASIRNDAEQAFLYKQYIKTEKKGLRTMLTGGIRGEKNWFWSDGTPFSYTCWAPHQPSGNTQDRVAFGHGKGGSWDDVSSAANRQFILQWTLY